MPWYEYGFSSHVQSALTNAGIASLGDLCSRTEPQLLHLPGIGRARLKEIRETLARIDRFLGDTIPESLMERLEKMPSAYEDARDG